MKAFKNILATILVGLLLVSCNNATDPMENTTDTEKNDVSNTETVAKTDEITTGNIDENTTDNGNNPDVPEPPKSSKLNSLIYNDGTYSSSAVEYDDNKNFRSKKYQDEEAPKTRTVKIFDVEHTLTYKESYIMEYTGLSVDDYAVDDIEHGGVEFIADSDQIFGYYNIPMQAEIITEQEYRDFIRSLVPADIDFLSYDCHVVTYYKDSSKNMDEKFVGKDEDADVKSHIFTYNEKYKNVGTGNSIYFLSDRDNTFMMRIVTPNYEKEMLHKTIDEFLAASDEFQSDMFAKIKEPCTPQEMTNYYSAFFMRDGKAYISSNIGIKITYVEEDGTSFTETEDFRVITSLKSDEDTSEN